MSKQHYHTAGREALLSFLAANPDRQFSADELYHAVSSETAVGKSSIYRLLSLMSLEQTVQKFQRENGACVYQYVGDTCDCRSHFHERCTFCGKVTHLDCRETEEFVKHLEMEHGFSVDPGKTILYGVCDACREKGGERNG